MKSNKSGTTIIEAIIAMFIIIVGTIGVYTIYAKSQKISISVENRVKAISIAREGIEVIQNIRDTNWVLFGADSKNCWNVKDYEINCLGDNVGTHKIPAGSYKIIKDVDNRWKLIDLTSTTGNYDDQTFRDTFVVNVDADGLYTQSGGAQFKPLFTRKIEISYIDTNSSGNGEKLDEKMLVKSIVSWGDNSKVGFYTVTLENLLTNWKED
ncbi:hypothetical protein EOM39_05755 [Candidatus Gracilibacteria bacterium]|nr:hypothetical protein [Candidatus Gracilibacteria bacterium]